MSVELQILITTFSSSGLLTFIIWLAKKRIASGIESSIKNKYDSKLELLKSEFSKSQSILATSFSAQTEGIKATIEKRLNAIDKYWEFILEIEELSKWSTVIESILTIDEVENIQKVNSSHPKKFQKTLQLTFEQMDMQHFIDSSSAQKKELEKLRPYIGEQLWLLRSLFVQLIGRVMNQYKEAYEQNKKLTHWTKDKFLIDSLSQELTKEELDFILNSQIGHFEKAKMLFKQKILTEISRITSGNLVGESSLKHAITLSNLMKK